MARGLLRNVIRVMVSNNRAIRQCASCRVREISAPPCFYWMRCGGRPLIEFIDGLLVRGPLVAGVPARDMVAFTRAENRQGLAFMRSRVSEVLEEGGHTLTRHFLVRQI